MISGEEAMRAPCSALLAGLPVAREGEEVRSVVDRGGAQGLTLSLLIFSVTILLNFPFSLGRSSKLKFPLETLYLAFSYYVYIVEVKC